MIKKLSKNMAISGAFILGFAVIVALIGFVSKLFAFVLPELGPFGDFIVTVVSCVLVSGVIMTGVEFFINRKEA